MANCIVFCNDHELKHGNKDICNQDAPGTKLRKNTACKCGIMRMYKPTTAKTTHHEGLKTEWGSE